MGFFSLFFPWGAILQVVAIVHFIRRRPDTIWLWVIVFLGPLGALVYIAMEVAPDAALLRQSFEGYGRRKRIGLLEAIVLQNPAAGNFEELADLYLEEGKFGRARECYDRAISPRTEEIDPFYRRGIAEIHLGDFDAAVRDLELVTSRNPKYDLHRAIALLAHAYANSGQLEKAETLFRHATDVSTISETYINYATFLASQNRPAEARHWAELVLAKKPTMPRYLQRRERPWFRKASALLKRLPKSGGAAATVSTLLLVVLLHPVVAAQPPGTSPIWAKPDLFWYRIAVEGGHLWVKVDAQHGVKEPLFDHQRLAIELTIRTGIEYTPLTLPFADPASQFVVKYDGSNAYIQEGAMAVEFVHGGQQWRCDLQIKWDWNRVPPTDYECLPRRPAAPAQGSVATTASGGRVSPDGRWEAFVDNHNVAIRPAGGGEARILSSDGSPTMTYQPGSIRWTADSSAVSAYRVSPEIWSSPSVNGNVKKLVARAEWTVPR
jgi:hypothetical protein